jgi:hypothetical protein
MRKLVIGSMAMFALIVSSCHKAETPAPAVASVSSYATAKGGPQSTVTTYAGRATGVDATIRTLVNGTIYSNQYLLAQTASLPLTGGAYNSSVAPASVTNVLSADTLAAVTTGQGGSCFSQAFAGNLSINAGGHVITATSVQATANASCGVRNGSTQISNLVVDGTTITVTGAANQVIFFPTGGILVINEQSTSKKVTSANVTGLRLNLPNTAEIRVAVAVADIKC